MDQKRIFISGADRGLGYGMTEQLLADGHLVLAGQFMPEWEQLEKLKTRYTDSLFLIPLDVGSDKSVRDAAVQTADIVDALDVLISNTGVIGYSEKDQFLHIETETALHTLNVNSLGAARLVECFYPLMQNGCDKKLCFVSSEAGSITQAQRTEMFSYCMSKAALNMYVRILYNRLHPEGYLFRLYHPGWIRSYMSGELSQEANLDISEAAEIALDYFLKKSVNEDELVLYGYDGEHFAY